MPTKRVNLHTRHWTDGAIIDGKACVQKVGCRFESPENLFIFTIGSAGRSVTCRLAMWAGRFKSTILEGSREALWNGVKYVELNPVRAGIVEDSADYRFFRCWILEGLHSI